MAEMLQQLSELVANLTARLEAAEARIAVPATTSPFVLAAPTTAGGYASSVAITTAFGLYGRWLRTMATMDQMDVVERNRLASVPQVGFNWHAIARLLLSVTEADVMACLPRGSPDLELGVKFLELLSNRQFESCHRDGLRPRRCWQNDGDILILVFLSGSHPAFMFKNRTISMLACILQSEQAAEHRTAVTLFPTVPSQNPGSLYCSYPVWFWFGLDASKTCLSYLTAFRSKS
eukprot:TRINITY_DN3099_c0_g1_i1.p1 TRINITY_DN3099_c0_g1~~TRINITY_DN3099_c0_g1_i1.p1  ORF type:complete len:234 (+),score=14.13 TRINITY_DN3099_c0_g1_i1:178-879(+)